MFTVAQLLVSTSTNQTDSQKPPFLPGVLIKSNPVWSAYQTIGGAGVWWYQKGPVLFIPSLQNSIA